VKRLFDFTASLFGLIILSPLFLILILLIIINSKGGAFYKQTRVGQYNKDFKLFKFRSMYVNAEKFGLLTVGAHDQRITPIGAFLRRYKLDELPQLINVFYGEMSLVGPRPEVRKYVDMYTEDQLKVLELKPGITDMASIKYKDENDILARYENAEEAYIQIIVPDKIKVNLEFFKESQSVMGSIKIIYFTIRAIFVKKYR
jgi:lipopolysaccharide/colanic/teichoic acid biosynthesis glycosyltransferase